MKKKRVLFLILAVCIAGTVVTGCTAEPPVNEEPTEAKDETTPEPEATVVVEEEFIEEGIEKYEGITGEPYKIGFTYLPETDTLSAAFHKVLDYTAAQFGCEMLYGEMSSGATDEVLANYENHVQAGVDAYIAVGLSGAAVELFDQNEVYFVIGGNTIEDPDTLALAMESDYYCGSIMADEIQMGYELCEKIYNAGSRNIAYMSVPAGYAASHDNRVRGIEKFVEEHPDITIATSYRGTDFVAAPGEVIAAFPDIEGILSTACIPTIPAAIYAEGRENDIKYAAIDIQEGIDTWFKDDLMAGCAGGQYPVMQMAFVVLYEALSSGDMLIADKSGPLNGPYIWITNYEEYTQYVKYMDGDIPAYTSNELKDLCGYFNTETSLEDRQQRLVDTWGGYSLEDVISRHEDLF